MRYVYFLLLFFGLSLSSLSAQSYQPTAVDGRKMYVRVLAAGPYYTDIYRIRRDTAAQPTPRFLFLKEDTNGVVQDTTAHLYEDTAAQTLTIDYPNVSYVLYFDLLPGDSVKVPAWVPPDSNWLVVDSISTFTDQNNTTRQHFHGRVVGPSRAAPVDWIEGLGSLRGLSNPYPFVRAFVDLIPYITCLYENNGLLYSNLQPGDNCYETLTMSTSEQGWFEPQVYPQPASQTLSIESTRALSRYEVLNSQGQSIDRGRLATRPYRLSTAGWADGIYFLRLWDRRSASTRLRFTVR